VNFSVQTCKRKDITRRTCQFLPLATVLVTLLHCAWSQVNAPHPDVDPAEIVTIAREDLKLSASKPDGWKSGTPLPGVLTGNPGSELKQITEEGAFDPKSLVLRRGDRVLAEGTDYLLDPQWAVLGIGPQSSITTADTVTASYRFSLLRLDSMVRGMDGKEYVKRGKSSITTPHPPDLVAGETRIANIYVPYYSDGKAANTLLFPVLETSASAKTLTTSMRIPKTMQKLQSGRRVRIVCWGDSITAGGDATLPKDRYTALLQRALRTKFPQANVTVKSVAAAASTSRMWLYPDKFPYTYRDQYNPSVLSWREVVKSKPDLVTIEFLNDSFIDDQNTFTHIYGDILARLKNEGTEVILITPSFANLAMMKFNSYNQRDERLYTSLLRRLSVDHSLALADVSSRWDHLVTEGIPYTTYLVNGINHPDNRGHEIFVEELIKNFD
jgi:lysophospholipase L1-like esterase